MNAPIDHTAENHRSYSVRIPRGGADVRALRPIHMSRRIADGPNGEWNYQHDEIEAGTVFHAYGDSNAGFRGIELHADLGCGWHCTVSTGAVELV